jgi:hypothetical protein
VVSLTVACVEVENYLGRGEEYVRKLFRSLCRNLSQPFGFHCITQSDKPGWWAKVDMFKPGLFKGRVLYLDLDTVIMGSLDELVQHKGILYLRDWGWKTPTYGSGVMVWDADEHAEIYERYTPDVEKQFKGDQDYLTALGGWDALPARLNASYRYHAKRNGPPPDAVTISFHGKPKMHEFPSGHWVHRYWR